MRRLVHHAAVGLGCTALAVSAAVAGVGSPAGAGTDTVIAVPASVTAATAPESAPPAAVERAEPGREAEDQQVVAAATVEQAAKRNVALTSQSRSIDQQRAKIAAAKIAAAKKAAVADTKTRSAKAKARVAKAEAKAARQMAAAQAAARAAEAEAAAAEKARLERVEAEGYEAGTTDPREIAKQILENKFGYGADEFSCFNNIIIRESNWDIDATNPSSGAYGIPQALPGSKMATVAGDWRTNPATQIIWAVGYMKDRYGSPCSAWSFKSANGWY